MKIIGGNFGLGGSAYLTRDKKLQVKGATNFAYIPETIAKIHSRIESNKKFGFIGFIVGSIILSIILGLLIGILGIIIAVIVTLIGSFYSDEKNILDVTFTDGNQVSLECTPRQAKSLYRFKENK